MRAAIYCRISNDPTGRQAGVQRQEADCRDLVDRNDWELAELFVDNDVSAVNGHRPAFEAMLERVRAGDLDAVVTWHVDRLYRQPRELEDLIDLVEGGALPGGVRTVTAGDIDLNTSSGRLVARMLVGVSKNEVERTQERLEAMNRHAAAQGKRVGGRRPFGYETDGAIREAETAVYREMARRVLEGESLRSLVADLNERGVTTAADNPWSMRALRDVLRNPRYAGKRTYKGEVVADAEWEALIPEDDHRRLVAFLNDPSRRVSPGSRRRWYLAGLARCGKCGTPLKSGRVGGELRTPGYRCPPSSSGGCGGVSVVAEHLEEHVRAAVFAALEDPRVGEALADAQAEGDTTAVYDELTDVDRRLTELADAYSEGEIDRAQMTRATERLRARRETLQRAILPRGLQVPSAPDLAAERWAEDVEFRHQLTAAMFEVVVHPAPVPGRNEFDPERVEIIPR